jgi:hypothetical protein
VAPEIEYVATQVPERIPLLRSIVPFKENLAPIVESTYVKTT